MGVYVAWLESMTRAAGTFFFCLFVLFVGSRVLFDTISEEKRGGGGLMLCCVVVEKRGEVTGI